MVSRVAFVCVCFFKEQTRHLSHTQTQVGFRQQQRRQRMEDAFSSFDEDDAAQGSHSRYIPPDGALLPSPQHGELPFSEESSSGGDDSFGDEGEEEDEDEAEVVYSHRAAAYKPSGWGTLTYLKLFCLCVAFGLLAGTLYSMLRDPNTQIRWVATACDQRAGAGKIVVSQRVGQGR